jgi:hypothetical protein
MTEKLNIARYKMSPGTIWQDNLDIATVYEEEYLHLLAAAPLMLEALTRLLEIIERDDNVTHHIEYADSTILDQARAAIAAAKGK